MAGGKHLRCPSCSKSLGGRTLDGDVSVRLAITLVKSDGTVHGPCSGCGADVVLVAGGVVAERVAKALNPEPAPPPRGARRFVLDLRGAGG